MATHAGLLVSIATTAIMASAANAAPMPHSEYRVVARQVIDGPVRWDYLAVDSIRHHLFLTRGDHVDVFDAVSKSVIGTIVDTAGVHGVAVASEINRGYTSNGGSDSVTVFDLASLVPIATVKVGAKPDSIVYDSATKRVFAANGKDRTLSVIDTRTNHVIKAIDLAGTPETAVVDGKGHLFVALEDKNAIAVVDTAAMSVVGQYDIGSACDEPARACNRRHRQQAVCRLPQCAHGSGRRAYRQGTGVACDRQRQRRDCVRTPNAGARSPRMAMARSP